MESFILCPECSEDLADILPFYNIVKNKKCEMILKDHTIDVDNLDFRSDILVNFEFILEALHINNACCRIHILGNTEYDTLY